MLLAASLFASVICASLFVYKSGGVGKAMFKLGYALYTSPAGLFIHKKQLARVSGPHTNCSPLRIGHITVLPIANQSDNYAYLIIDEQARNAVAVDPADPALIEKSVASANVTLRAILTTHKHWDHSGGNASLARAFPKVAIVGSPLDKVPNLTHPVEHNATVAILPNGSVQVSPGPLASSASDLPATAQTGLCFRAISSPGHTPGHFMFLLHHPGSPTTPASIFTGDCLFVAGCGKLFEGSARQMYDSLRVFHEIDGSTLVWPGHEYAYSNLRFCVQLEPDNAAVAALLEKVRAELPARVGCIPSSVQQEKSINPFLRVHLGAFDGLVSSSSSSSSASSSSAPSEHRVQVLAEIRKRKNNFK